MTAEEIRALEPNARQRMEQFRDCFKKSRVFDYFDTTDRSHFHRWACVDFLAVVRSSDVVEGAESRLGVG